MPTLLEFVNNVLAENHIVSDPEQIIKQITEIAKQRPRENNCVAISDDEIRDMVINNADLARRLADEKKAREAERLEAVRKREKEEKLKALEKERKTAEGEQTTLF